MKRVGLLLRCEGMGDCLYAVPVIRKMWEAQHQNFALDIFSLHPALFARCPYVENSYPVGDGTAVRVYAAANQIVRLFELEKNPHWLMDTTDFITMPLGIGTLGFAEKQLEYFPQEEDVATPYDVVINASMTWPSRSWPLTDWQRLADALLARGFSVAVVGRDVTSRADKMTKHAHSLNGCVDLVNKLSLDQTYFTIARSRVFVSGQNGLSVLAGTTDTEIVVLDMSIDWSKRALYRNADPFYKITYVRGACTDYCGSDNACPKRENGGIFKCQPDYAAVEAAVLARLEGADRVSGLRRPPHP